MRALIEKKVLFFGGKGGVGKTTSAAAMALAASRAGKRVLLVSTDPAHSTSDIFEMPIGPEPTPLLPNLHGLEIDSEFEAKRYVAEVKDRIRDLFGHHIQKEANKQIELAASMPGAEEMALFDRIGALIRGDDDRFDLIVFDTAPTGHTLQLLRMPEAMDAWIQALMKHRRAVLEIDQGHEAEDEPALPSADPVLTALERRHQRITLLRRTVLDRARTSFVLVAIPERLAIEETVRAAELLGATGIDVAALIVNRVLPDQVEGEFFRSRKAQEAQYLQEIAQRFARTPRVNVRQLPRDVYGLAALEAISDQLL